MHGAPDKPPQPPTPPDGGAGAPKEPLGRMSIGDHLDELRKRLFICIAAVGVCVMGMMFFKSQVTGIYMGPYRIAWQMAYEDYLVFRDQQFQKAAFEGPAADVRKPGQTHETLPPARQKAWLFLQEHRDQIRDGTLQDPARIATEAGFAEAWVAAGKPGRQAWLEKFDAFDRELLEEVRGLAKANLFKLTYEFWEFNHEYRDLIRTGNFPEKSAIRSQSGFPLPWSLLSGSPLQDFWTFMAAAALFGVILSSPIILWQIWSFIAAGLYVKERRVVHRTAPFTILLTVTGVTFGYLVVVPYGLYFLTRIMDPEYTEPWFQVSMYFKLFLMLTLALGLVFQMPVVMWALCRVGLVSHQAMIKHWRWVILGCFLFSAMLTPPDPFTQAFMAGPMVLLYFLGLFLTWRVSRKLAKTRSGTA